MNKYTKYLKALLYIFIPILFFSLILSLLYYFNIISDKSLNILKIITTLISFIIGGIYIGKKSNKKGYLEGLKIGLIIIFLFFTISFLAFDKGMSIKNLIYYLVILATSTTGSMIGINKKKN